MPPAHSSEVLTFLRNMNGSDDVRVWDQSRALWRLDARAHGVTENEGRVRSINHRKKTFELNSTS